MRKYWTIASVSFKNQWVYKGDILGRSGFFVLIIFIFSQLWRKVIDTNPSAALYGFSRGDLVWYLAVTEMIIISSPAMTGFIDEDIKSGAIAYQLVRPYSLLHCKFAEHMGQMAARLIFNVVVCAATATALVGLPHIGWLTIPATGLAVAGGITLNFFMRCFIAFLAFWFEETNPFYWIYSKILFILGGVLIPLEFYPGWLSSLAQWLPFQGVAYAPAKIFIRPDPHSLGVILLTQIAWAFACYGASAWLLRLGLSKVHVHGG